MVVAKVLTLRKQVAEESANNDDWPHALNSSSIRLFDVLTLNLEANAYYELAPAIASLTDREIEECLKKPLVLHHPGPCQGSPEPPGRGGPSQNRAPHFTLLLLI